MALVSLTKEWSHLLVRFTDITRFYARQQNASRVLAIVCPSVRPSVTLVICIKTVQARITKSSLFGLPQGL